MRAGHLQRCGERDLFTVPYRPYQHEQDELRCVPGRNRRKRSGHGVCGVPRRKAFVNRGQVRRPRSYEFAPPSRALALIPASIRTHDRLSFHPLSRLCRPGSRSRHTSVACYTCPTAKLPNALQGSTSCSGCPRGSVPDPTGVFCKVCPIGTIANLGDVACSPCRPPETTTQAGSTVCDGCIRDYYRKYQVCVGGCVLEGVLNLSKRQHLNKRSMSYSYNK